MKLITKNFVLLFLSILIVLFVSSCGSKNVLQDGDYKIEFNTLGIGETPSTQIVEGGEHVSKPLDLVEKGYLFMGWYKDDKYNEKFDFDNDVVKSNITLYAKWISLSVNNLPSDKTPSIYLAGDSTVQTYADEQYIAGWGQYLSLFLDEKVNVINAARGGRSSRSFINEDRLFTPSTTERYSFSENGGKSIEETIKEGDFLFIQFGHNDDDTKGTSTMPDRMVQLGTPDSNGIYPTIAPSKKYPTTYLPSEYLADSSNDSSKMLTEIAKYGDDYYAYGDGTYKWFLKQYIDLARRKNAIPVLLTPVARVSFNSDGTLKSGAGLHGQDFAYVKAVRQLADEENCLLIDNFEGTKNILEKLTSEYADFLMALVPNSLNNGPWPSGYDDAYKNVNAGYEKIEGTHYNKYGAFITCAYIVDNIIKSNINGIIKNEKEYYNFTSYIKTTPTDFIDPSNRLSISLVNELEGMFDYVNPTNSNRVYLQPKEVSEAIINLTNKGTLDSINSSNYESWKEYCSEVRNLYNKLNFDYRDDVYNYDILISYEEKVNSLKPKPNKTVVLSANDFVDSKTPINVSDHLFTFDSNIEEYSKKAAAFTYNDILYEATSNSIRFAGNSKLTSEPTKYLEFNITGACSITVVASGGGETSRYIQVVNSSNKAVGEFEITASQTIQTLEFTQSGTYKMGSKGSNIDLYYIIIEYYS